MMVDVFIYHAHTFFVLLCACVGYLDFVSTSASRELTIRALESEPPPTMTILHCTCLYFGIVKDAQGHAFKVISFSFENLQTMSMDIMDHTTCVAFPMRLIVHLGSLIAHLLEILLRLVIFTIPCIMIYMPCVLHPILGLLVPLTCLVATMSSLHICHVPLLVT